MTTGQKAVAAIRDHLARSGMKWSQLNGDAVAKIIDDALPASKRAQTTFTPPTPEEIAAYSASIGYPLDGQAWCDHYETKGWKTSGSTKMVSWQAAVRKWKSNGWTPNQAHNGQIGQQNASLGALQLQLGRVERELEDILRPGGSAYTVTPTGEKLERYHTLMTMRRNLKEKIDSFGSNAL